MNDTDPRPVRIAVITASTRDGRRGRNITDWYLKEIASDARIEVDDLDLADVALPDRYTFDHHDGVARFGERVDAADAFVVITPEYNHSFPAPLKHAIDFAKDEWRRKPVAFVSYGGVSGGLRAVEHLRQVFAELHVTGLRDTVSFHGPFNGFGDDGPSDRIGASRAVTTQLDDLLWWATTLRLGRSRTLEGAW